MKIDNRLQIHILLIVLLLAVPVMSLGSSNSFSKYGATFLQISSGARQVAMAEAFTALAYDDINLMRYNIGGLASIEKVMLSVNYHQWIDDTEQGSFGFSLPFRFGVMGFDFSYFNEGSITQLDENFQITGNVFKSNDIAMTLGYGSKLNVLNNQLLFGGGVKLIRQDLADESASAVGVDLGLLFWLKHLSFGMSMQNFSVTKLKFLNEEQELPELYRAGIGAHFPTGRYLDWNLDVDLGFTQDQDLRYYAGSEVVINELLMVRGGYKIHDTDPNRWAVGLGLNMPMPWLAGSETRFDYSYSTLRAFDESAHRFSMLFRFGVKPKSAADRVAEEKSIEELNKQLKKELEAAERARLAAEEAEMRTRALEDTMRARLDRIKKIAELSGGKIEVQELATADSAPGSISDRILVSMHINFDFDKANIRAEEFSTMNQVGTILNTYPESQVFISGHTDHIGTDEYNIRLSHRRVDSVMTYLSTKEDVASGRFYNPIGYGELKPVDTNDTEEGRFRNRRVDFIIYTMDAKPEIPEGSAIIDVQSVDDSTIYVIGNGTLLNFEHRLMEDPERIVIDLKNIFVMTDKMSYDGQGGAVNRVRLGYHPEKVFSRVVLDLKAENEYDIYSEENRLVIEVK